MKNIKLYESFDPQAGDGFALSIIASGRDISHCYIHIFSGDDFYSAVSELYDLLSLNDFVDDPVNPLDAYDLCQKLTESLYFNADDVDYTFWSGLIPSSRFTKSSISLSNPYSAMDLINKSFTNADRIFSKYQAGNMDDLDYLYSAIKRNPRNLERFINDEHVAEFDDLLKGLKETNKLELLDPYFKRNPLDMHYLDRYPEIKKGVIERTGLKDLSKLGKSMKDGMI
jgi:hypothetical protein